MNPVERITTARRGAMLLLALFFIVAATSLAALIMAGSAQLIRTTRSEHELILVRQLTDSGRAWVLAQDGQRPVTSLTLSGAALLPEGVFGEVRISMDRVVSDVFILTAIVRLSGHEVSRTSRFRLPA